MKINEKCLPCLVNQAIKICEITKIKNREQLYKDLFLYLSTLDFSKSNPEVIGYTFRLLKKYTTNLDPYLEIRNYYNTLFLNKSDYFQSLINSSSNSFNQALMIATIGNIIDFNPIHQSTEEEKLKWFDGISEKVFTINHSNKLIHDIKNSTSLLYLGDNCGEICLDKLFIKKIKEVNPNLTIYFGVRGAPVVNDSIEEDAYYVGMDEIATIISNGDDSLGTVLSRVSEDFLTLFNQADMILSKGQANYESLSEVTDKNIYFLLVTKCDVIANDIGVPTQSIICMNNKEVSNE